MSEIKFFSMGMILMLIIAGIMGCEKDNSAELKEKEKRLLEQYVKDNNITQEPTETGLYYIPIEPGDGLKPNLTDYVEIQYVGELVDGTIFGTTYKDIAQTHNIYDSEMLYGTARFMLENTLAGLVEGISMMQEGEKAMLILPSDIALGARYTPLIPSYSTLIYTVELETVISDPVAHENKLIQDFLDSNDYEVQPTESGLYYIETQEGTGDLIENGNTVSVWYTGYFIDDRVFSTNDGAEQPYYVTIPGKDVITGWNEGLKLMRKDSKGTLIIPYDLGFGEEGLVDSFGRTKIPPYMTLVFDIEVVDVIL